MYQREAHPGSGKLGRVVQPLEHAEELGDVAWVEAYAVVAYEIDVFRLALVRVDFDHRGVLPAGKLVCVGEQVRPHLGEYAAIAGRRRQRADAHPRLRSTVSGIERIEVHAHELRHVDAFHLQRLSPEP